jgi:biopolymer transport protein TolR
MSQHSVRRRHRKQKKGKVASLNLVSLMDIFTILVFFLMVNSSEVEVLQTSSKIKLPDSNSEQSPKNQLMISVTENDLIVQGRSVAKVGELQGASLDPALGAKGLVIPGLQAELQYQASRRGEIPEGGFKVTVVGDKELPYWLLKRILMTCQTADFAQVSLAVNKVGGVETVEDLAAAENTAAAPVQVEQGAAS